MHSAGWACSSARSRTDRHSGGPVVTHSFNDNTITHSLGFNNIKAAVMHLQVGRAPLHVAAQTGNLESLIRLLDAGAHRAPRDRVSPTQMTLCYAWALVLTQHERVCGKASAGAACWCTAHRQTTSYALLGCFWWHNVLTGWTVFLHCCMHSFHLKMWIFLLSQHCHPMRTKSRMHCCTVSWICPTTSNLWKLLPWPCCTSLCVSWLAEQHAARRLGFSVWLQSHCGVPDIHWHNSASGQAAPICQIPLMNLFCNVVWNEQQAWAQ